MVHHKHLVTLKVGKSSHQYCVNREGALFHVYTSRKNQQGKDTGKYTDIVVTAGEAKLRYAISVDKNGSSVTPKAYDSEYAYCLEPNSFIQIRHTLKGDKPHTHKFAYFIDQAGQPHQIVKLVGPNPQPVTGESADDQDGAPNMYIKIIGPNKAFKYDYATQEFALVGRQLPLGATPVQVAVDSILIMAASNQSKRFRVTAEGPVEICTDKNGLFKIQDQKIAQFYKEQGHQFGSYTPGQSAEGMSKIQKANPRRFTNVGPGDWIYHDGYYFQITSANTIERL